MLLLAPKLPYHYMADVNLSFLLLCILKVLVGRILEGTFSYLFHVFSLIRSSRVFPLFCSYDMVKVQWSLVPRHVRLVLNDASGCS